MGKLNDTIGQQAGKGNKMKMFSTCKEAREIFEAISPETIFTIREEISGDVTNGTKMYLFYKICNDDRETSGNVSHVPASYYYQGEEPTEEYIQAMSIIECAYSFF